MEFHDPLKQSDLWGIGWTMPLSLPTASLDLNVVIVHRNNTGNLRNLEWCQILESVTIVFTQLAVVVS